MSLGAKLLVAFLMFAAIAVLLYIFSKVNKRIRSGYQQAADKIALEREQLRSLINSMADAVIATDSSGRILFYNGATLGLLNTNAGLERKLLSDFMMLYDEDGKHVDLLQLVRTEQRSIKRDDLHFISNENEPVDVYANIAPIHSTLEHQQAGQGFIVLLRDITKQKTLEEERDEFISVTSHELRTPIAITEANISTAMHPSVGKNLDPAVKQLLEQAHNNIIFLGDLVNDLTTLARAERGDLKIDTQPIDPGQLLQQLSHDYQKEATVKGLSITVSVAPNAPKITTSPLYLREILQNFVTNAIKYTEKGKVGLAAKLGDRGRVVFAISDNGIGIAKADRTKIFSKFYRSEDYRTRKTRGTGLGLYITLKLAERLNGKIWFDSKLNEGSTFYLEVPSLKIHRHPETHEPIEASVNSNAK